MVGVGVGVGVGTVNVKRAVDLQRVPHQCRELQELESSAPELSFC